MVLLSGHKIFQAPSAPDFYETRLSQVSSFFHFYSHLSGHLPAPPFPPLQTQIQVGTNSPWTSSPVFSKLKSWALSHKSIAPGLRRDLCFQPQPLSWGPNPIISGEPIHRLHPYTAPLVATQLLSRDLPWVPGPSPSSIHVEMVPWTHS